MNTQEEKRRIEIGKTQKVIEFIRKHGSEIVYLPNTEMKKLVDGNSYELQKTRYNIPILDPHIAMELSGDSENKKKKSFGYRVLSEEETKNYAITGNNFRFLTDEQIHYITSALQFGNKSVDLATKYNILLICDVFLAKNPRNEWCLIAKRFFTSFLCIQKEVLDIFISTLIDSDILIRTNYFGKNIYKICFSKEEYDYIKNDVIPTINDHSIEVIKIGLQQTLSSKIIKNKIQKALKDDIKEKGIDKKNKFDIIENDEKPNMRPIDDSANTGNLVNMFSNFIKDYRALSSENERLKAENSDLRIKFESLMEKNKKDYKTFEAVNEDYNQKVTKIKELEDTIKSYNDCYKDAKSLKKNLEDSIGFIIDSLSMNLTKEIFYFTSTPANPKQITEFQSKCTAMIKDARTALRNSVTAKFKD